MFVLLLTGVVGQSLVVQIEDEPSPPPGLHSSSAFGQKAAAPPRRQIDPHTARHVMTQRLHVSPQVKVHRQRQRDALLNEKNTFSHLADVFIESDLHMRKNLNQQKSNDMQVL